MKKERSLTNKGFSLVELIIVVAILAILMAILAPQYLRYVERARLQKDNSSIGEFANTIKIASAEEDIIGEINAGLNASDPKAIQFVFTNTGVTFANSGTYPKLTAEIKASLGELSDIKMTSNTYGATGPTVEVTVSNNIMSIKATSGWVDRPGVTAGTKTF